MPPIAKSANDSPVRDATSPRRLRDDDASGVDLKASFNGVVNDKHLQLRPF